MALRRAVSLQSMFSEPLRQGADVDRAGIHEGQFSGSCTCVPCLSEVAGGDRGTREQPQGAPSEEAVTK